MPTVQTYSNLLKIILWESVSKIICNFDSTLWPKTWLKLFKQMIVKVRVNLHVSSVFQDFLEEMGN